MKRASDPAQERDDPEWALLEVRDPHHQHDLNRLSQGCATTEISVTPTQQGLQVSLLEDNLGAETHDEWTHSQWTPAPERGGDEVEESDSETGNQANLHQTSGSAPPRKSMIPQFLHL